MLHSKAADKEELDHQVINAPPLLFCNDTNTYDIFL